jgi:hypothetical protein
VLIQVWPEQQPGVNLATINYGWESILFYARWLHGDLESAHEIIEASLDPINAQSKHSGLFLALFRDTIHQDLDYVERLARHYEMFKRADKKKK